MSINDTAIEDFNTGGGYTGARDRGVVQTRVDLDQSTNLYGSTTVQSGQLVGAKGRTVVVEATPRPGYVFARWEVTSTPIELAWVADVVNQTFAELKDACASTDNTSARLYTDGITLFWDNRGVTEAANGWYKSGGTYINYTAQGKIEKTTECPTSGGGGTSGPIVPRERETEARDTE